MKKKRLIELLSCVVVVAIVCCIPAFTKTARGTCLTEEEIKVREMFLTEAGVPDDVLEKLSVGQMDMVYRSLEEGMEYFYYESRESYAIEFKNCVQVEPTEPQQPMMTISLLVFRKTEAGEADYALFPGFRWNEETELTGDGFEVWVENGLKGTGDKTEYDKIKYQLWDAEKRVYIQECDPALVMLGEIVTIEWKRSINSTYAFEGVGYLPIKGEDDASVAKIYLGYVSSTPAGEFSSVRPQATIHIYNGEVRIGPVQEGNARCCIEEFEFSVE